VADESREKEVVIRLARIGYDNALGYLKVVSNLKLTQGNLLMQLSN